MATEGGTVKTALAVVGAVIGVIAFVAAVWAIAYALGVTGNKVQASYNKRVVTSKIQQNVNTADFAQSVYEGFFKECNDVVAMNGQIENLKARVAAALALPNSYTKDQRVSDAQNDLTGAENQQLTIAADYDAKAAEWTRGQFKDSNLPDRLTPPFNSVSCG